MNSADSPLATPALNSSGGAATSTAPAERMPLPSWADLLLSVLVVLLAFLLASTPARNSDLWLHLASGRLLANGQYQFGVDPFAFTTAGVHWVNHSWLYDLLTFLVFQAWGGTALVAAKAVLIALLAWVLLRSGRMRKGNGWIAGVFAGLALFVIGPWMTLRPIGVSYLFLALTLWLLETRLAAQEPRALAAWLPLPLLFALWANLDVWFVLGPLTVGLYAVGSLLRGHEAAGQTRILGLVFLAGLAACLLNPHFYHVFALPPRLSFLAETNALREDPILGRLSLSPFQSDYVRFHGVPPIGRLLYYPLVLAGIVSFVLNGVAALRRLPVWLVFFGLSAWDTSIVPFFALVAGPTTALNFQEYARRREAKRALGSWWAIGGRLLALAAGVGLLLAAWPGWLQGQAREPRAWTLESDASLIDAARQLEQWRDEGRIGDTETGFNFSADAAHYFAWFAPREKGFHDSRWRLCAGAAADYVLVRRALLGDVSTADDCRRVLRERHVTHLVLHDSDFGQTAGVFQRLLASRKEWPILFLKGDTVIFGWRDPERAGEPDRFQGWRVDFERRAFQPAPEELAPARGSTREPASGWRSLVTPAASSRSHADNEAALYLIYFDTLRPSFLARQRDVWEHALAARALVAGTPSLSTVSRQFLDGHFLWISREGLRPRADGGVWPLDALALHLADNHMLRQDDGPPSLLLLAVRAARRAIRDNPDDAHAYRLLGEAYLHLMRNTRQRAWKRELTSLAHIRQIQALTALHQALLLQPDLIQAHSDLCGLYQDMGLLDLALSHLRHVLRLAPTQGRFLGESDEARTEQLHRLEQAVDKLDAEVRRRLEEYKVRAARRPVLEQATLALERGLADKALDILLASDVAVFGGRGTEMELDLLLTVGRLHDAREWMAPIQEAELGRDSYHRLRVLLAVAAGDYEACDEELSQIAAALDRPVKAIFEIWKINPAAAKQRSERPGDVVLQVTPRQLVCLKLAQIFLDAPRQKQTIPWLLQYRFQMTELLEHIQKVPTEIRQWAEVNVLRGLLALERGDVSRAEEFLRRALSIWRSEADAASGSGLDFAGRRAAQGLLEWLTQPPAVVP